MHISYKVNLTFLKIPQLLCFYLSLPKIKFRFNNETKNYKVYYDGAFYVGEKRFDTIEDLVHDGLISFYIEKHASNYIACMSEENNYAESPYVASKTALLARQKREPSSVSPSHIPTSIHTSFQKQHQLNHQQPQHQQSVNLHQHHQQHFHFPTQQQHHQGSHHQQIQPQQQHQQHQHHHQMFQQSIIETTQSNNSLNQLDKENRLFNISLSSDSTNGSKFMQSSTKSNAIFDRFDIINSEKPHRFKVRIKN